MLRLLLTLKQAAMYAIRILLIEPDQQAAARFHTLLQSSMYIVDIVFEGASGISLFSTRCYDMIIVDQSLPDMESGKVCLLAHQFSGKTVLLMLARDGDTTLSDDCRRAADHYLSLPVGNGEFLSRIEAVLKGINKGGAPSNKIQTGDLVLDLDSKSVAQSGMDIHITKSEFLLLSYMMRNQNRVVTREELSLSAWNNCRQPSDDKIGVHMSNLRKKLKTGLRPLRLYTVSRKGYLLTEELASHSLN